MADPVVYLKFRGDEHDAVRAADKTGDSLDRLERRTKSSGQQFTLFDRDVKQASRGAIAGSGAFRSMGRSIAFASGAFLGAAGFTAVVSDAIEVAKILGKETRKVELVFGSLAPPILAWSRTTATSLGLARDETLHFTAALGRTLIAMGKSRAEAARLAPEYVKIGTALAGFAGAEPEEGIEAVRAAIGGSTRSLREYSIYLTETKINAEAVRLGLVKSTVDVDAVAEAQTRLAIAQAKYNQALKEYGPGTTQVASAQLALKDAQDGLEKSLGGTTVKLTDQEKATARLSLIQRESATAQEHFNQKGASQTRTFHALVRDLEASLGEALLPTIRELMTELNEWLEGTVKSGEAQRKLKDAVAAVRNVVDALWPIIQTLAHVTQDGVEAVGGLRNAFKLLFAYVALTKFAAIVTGLHNIGLAAAGANMAGAGGAAAAVSVLRARLLLLARMSPILIPIALVMVNERPGRKGRGLENLPGFAGDVVKWVDEQVNKVVPVYKKPKPTAVGGSVYTPRTQKQGGNLQIPASYTPTHATAGFPGSKTAVDIFAEPGTRVLAPEDGRITRHSGSAPKAGSNNINGYSLYFVADSGTIWFMTHLATLSPLGKYKKGAVLATVAGGTAGGAHVHVDNNAPISFAGAASSASTAPARGSQPRGGGDLTVGTKDPKPKTKPFDLVPLVFQERLERAKLTQGMRDDLDALEDINKYLTKRLKLEKDRRKRIELLREIVSVRKEIADIKGVGQGPSRASLVAGLKELTGIVDKLPDDLQMSLRPKLKEIGALFAKMVTPDDRRKVLAQIKALRKEAADEIGKFADDAWGRVRDAVLNAFDQRVIGRVAGNREFAGTQLGRAQTQKRADRALGQIDTQNRAGLTPAMQTIKDRGEAVLAAWERVGAAIRGKDKDEIERAVATLAEAQNQFESIGGELTDAEQAYLTAWQALIDAAAAIGESALDDFQKAEEAKGRIARKALQPKLNKIYADLRAGRITMDQATVAINEILAPFGLSLADLGDTLDNAELTDALGELTGAIQALTGLLASGSGGPSGPDPRALPVPGRPGGVQGVDAVQVYPSQLVGAGAVQGGPQMEAVLNVSINGRVDLDGQQVGVLTFEPIRNEAIRFKRRTGQDAFAV